MPFFLILFIILPIAEMWVLIKVGSAIGALNTVGLVLLTAIIGLALLRQQGLETLLKANQRMEQGELPAEEIIGGMLLAMGGVMLLVPGFITDAMGLVCLLPFTRKRIVQAMIRNGAMMGGTAGGSTFFFSRGASFQNGAQQRTNQQGGHHIHDQQGAPHHPHQADTIDGECKRED